MKGTPAKPTGMFITRRSSKLSYTKPLYLLEKRKRNNGSIPLVCCFCFHLQEFQFLFLFIILPFHNIFQSFQYPISLFFSFFLSMHLWPCSGFSLSSALSHCCSSLPCFLSSVYCLLQGHKNCSQFKKNSLIILSRTKYICE